MGVRRHASTPRPAKGMQTAGYDGAEQTPAARPSSDVRRSKSTSRRAAHQHTTYQERNSYPSEAAALPRSVSTGRIRGQPTDDENAPHTSNWNEGGSALPRQSSRTSNSHAGNRVSSSYRKSASALKKEDNEADARLKQAETKISGLLEELEELKFFQEIETAPVTPRHPTPSRERSAAQQKQQHQQPVVDSSMKRDQSGIPKTIRATSNSRGGRLPPPPKNGTPSAGDMVGGYYPSPSAGQTMRATPTSSQTERSNAYQQRPKPTFVRSDYKPHSPRQISKMSRHELELECQTLARELQIVEQKAMTNYQQFQDLDHLQQQESTRDKAAIEQLERKTHDLHHQLKQQLQLLDTSKDQVAQEYKEKLDANISKLQRTQQFKDELQNELQETQKELKTTKQRMEQMEHQYRKERTQLEDVSARETVLELQLTETKSHVKALQEKLASNKKLTDDLTRSLEETTNALQEATESQEEAFEIRVVALEQQLKLANDRYKRLMDEHDQQSHKVLDQEQALKIAQAKEAELKKKLKDNEHAVGAFQEEARQKFEELKKSVAMEHAQKLESLVESRAQEAEEYQQQISELQQELESQAENHAMQIEELQHSFKQQQKNLREEMTERMQQQDSTRSRKLQQELDQVKEAYQKAQKEFHFRMRESEEKEQSTCEQFKMEDERRLREIEDIHERLAQSIKDHAEKDRVIESLQAMMKSDHGKIRDRIADIEAKHAEELLEKDEQLEQTGKSLKHIEKKLQDMNDKYGQLERLKRSNEEELQSELSEARELLAQAEARHEEEARARSRMREVQSAFGETKEQLEQERTRYEEAEGELRVQIAKLEGKLRASETNLRQKRSRIDELEEQLDRLARNQSNEEERIEEMQAMRLEMDDAASRLQKEKQRSNEKDATIAKLRDDVKSLRVKAKSIGQFDEMVQEMKQKVLSMQDEKKRHSEELSKTRSSVESLTAKLIEMEEQMSLAKEDHSAELAKLKRQHSEVEESLTKKTESLQSRIEFISSEKHDLQVKLDDLSRSLESTQREKARKENELSSLRSDYEDLSGLLEENLHASARSQDMESLFAEKQKLLEGKITQHVASLEEIQEKLDNELAAKSLLERTVADLKEQNSMLQNQIQKTTDELKTAKRSTAELEEKLSSAHREKVTSEDGVKRELGRRESHIRETVQRYSLQIAELEKEREEHLQGIRDMEDKLKSARNELSEKQRHTEELIQRHTKKVLKLEAEAENASMEREALHVRLQEMSQELEAKRRNLEEAVSKNSAVPAMSVPTPEQQAQIESLTASLTKKDECVKELTGKLASMLMDLEASNRENEAYRSKIEKLERAISDLERQYRPSPGTSNLNSDYLRHTSDPEEALAKVGVVVADAERKQQEFDELSRQVSDLAQKLEQANRAKELARLKAESLTKEADEAQSKTRMFEMEKIEIETRLHSHSRAKDELRGKISELTSKVERKEREIREVTDRYKMYILELESKLDQDSDYKSKLQVELDSARGSASSSASELTALRERVAVLERELDHEREQTKAAESFITEELNDKLKNVVSEKESLEVTLKKVNGEKAEVIQALEGVIHEVQNREDEIESLNELLHKRDEELEHAKIIATKALASAKEMQKRFKDKDSDRQNDLLKQIDGLSDTIDDLRGKNETYERKASMLERALRESKSECKRLKDQLRQIDSRDLGDDVSYTSRTSFTTPRAGRLRDKLSNNRISDDNTLSTYSMSQSYSNSDAGNATGSVSRHSERNSYAPADEDSPGSGGSEYGSYLDGNGGTLTSGDSNEMGSLSSGDSDEIARLEREVDDQSRSESVSSRRSIERDALRKYVRNRYMQRGKI